MTMAASSASSVIGTKCGDYLIHKYVGKGTFGNVYVVTSKSAKERGGENFTPTSLALKRIGLIGINNTQIKWLDREINILNDPELKQHPNIVRYVEYFIEDNFLHIVMDFYEGGTLFSYVRHRDVPESTFIEFLEQIINGLEFLHNKKIIHRDVKTKNILLTAHNDLKLADFGVARKIENVDLKMTKFVGTPNCMSPEVLSRNPSYGFKTDIWSLGCVCFEIGAKDYAFPGTSQSDIKEKVFSNQLPDIDGLCYCKAIKDMIKKMLQFKPEDRPTASDVKTFVTDQKPNTRFDVSNLSHHMSSSSLQDSGVITGRRSQEFSDSSRENADESLGDTMTELTTLQLQSTNLQAKIVKMIGDHNATRKLARIMRCFHENISDLPGLETKAKEVLGDHNFRKIYALILQLRGLEEGIQYITGQETDVFSTAPEEMDKI